MLAAVAATVLPAPAAAEEIVLRAERDHVVEAHINGRSVRLRVDPETPGYVMLNPNAALRVGAQPSVRHAATIIGPVQVHGDSVTLPVLIGGKTTQHRVVWTDRRAIDGADGMISPADLPYDRVTLQLQAHAPGETTYELPMRFERSLSLYHSLMFGGRPIHFRISTLRENSIATAAAGALLAQEFGGSWMGGLTTMMIKYGIARPVRPLVFERPLEVAGRPLGAFLVRTSDHRGSAVLPGDPSYDPDEIVVTAEVGRERPRYVISLGLDWLAGCSSITWDNRTRRMSLRCAPPASAPAPAA